MSLLTRCIAKILAYPPIAQVPVPVLKGMAAGAKWSLFPCTAYWRGTHEPEIQRRLVNLWDWRGKHVWDLGSHYGLFAVGLGRRVGQTGSVAAFEPNPVSFRRLALHLKRNHLAWVQSFPFALSNEAGKQRFFAYDGLESTSTHLAYEGESWNENIPSIEVECCRLDDLVAAGKIKLPNFVKVDVEGHGHKALLGAQHSLAASRPVLLIGLHCEPELTGIRAILDPLGYEYFSITGTEPVEPVVGFDYFAKPRLS